MLLTTLNRTKQVAKGNLKWIDSMIRMREELITMYFKILTIQTDPNIDHTISPPTKEELHLFCNLLVDYLSRGHFEIYPKILIIMEHVSNRRLTIARRLIPRIEQTTQELLNFSDKYANLTDDLPNPKEFRADLSILGQYLEIRFKHEDRMVIALQILDNTLALAKKLNDKKPISKEKKHDRKKKI